MRTRLTATIAILVALQLPSPRANAVCQYYTSAEEATYPLPPVDDPNIHCTIDAIVIDSFYRSECTNPPVPGSPDNASALEMYARCYDTRYSPPTCVLSHQRGSYRCVTSLPYPYPVMLCNDSCSIGAWARQNYFVPGPSHQLNPLSGPPVGLDWANAYRGKEALFDLILPPGYPFATPADIPEGRALFDLYAYLDQVHAMVLAENGEHLSDKLAVLDLATMSLYVADDAFQDGDHAAGGVALQQAKQLIDIVSDFLPGVSMVKDVVSLLSGYNPVTGDELSDVERALILSALLLPGVVAGAGKTFVRIAKGLERLRGAGGELAAHADDLIGVATRADAQLVRFLDGPLPCLIP